MKTREVIVPILRESIARGLKQPANGLDLHTALHRYGLDSIRATQLSAELNKLDFGRPCTPVLFWEYPTLDALASYFAGESVSKAARSKAHQPSVDAARSTDEPIAIVGMACRFPGAPDLQAFWRLLRDGVDAIGDVPPNRWGDGVTDAYPELATLRQGGFLERVDEFDAHFFGISPREASLMDPQQRLMLEVSWEALENAGISPLDLEGTSTGIFTGAIWTDYETLVRRAGSSGRDAHTSSGLHRSILANRVSYVLGLNGPSLAVDTACSSGLVAVHLACESLRRGEATLALAGGVNLALIPDSTVEVSRLGVLSPDGRCFTFDARANGFVRGEGAGVVVLKPLSRAKADADLIYGVIRGSAVNNDGASSGLTAPNPQAQEAMLRHAYARAGVAPRDVQYVEAHGTGTQMGDPIEARALSVVMCAERSADDALRIGSVKTNIGHGDAVAGIAGLIKVALSISNHTLPASLHFSKPNPKIAFGDLHLQVQRSTGEWPKADKPLTAGVSAFGFGGTNAHVVVQEPVESRAELLSLSAASPQALHEEVRSFIRTLARSERASLEVLCRAANGRSKPGPHRLAAVAHSRAELVGRLEAFLRGERVPEVATGSATEPRQVSGPVFVFSGQGTQRPGMGLELFDTELVFREAFEQCDALIRQHLGWSVIEELRAPRSSSRLDDVSVVIPAIVSLEVALVALWRSWGIRPAAVIGYSFGEIVAAHAAGVLSLEDAMLVTCQQGRFVRRTRGTGAMALLELPWNETVEALGPYAGRVFPAIHTGTAASVVAGEPAAVEEVLSNLERQGVFCLRFDMDVAPHSPQVRSSIPTLPEEFAAAIEGIRPRPATIPFMSTVTASWLHHDAGGPEHWVRHFVDPVFFGPAIGKLAELGFDTFVEVGPHPLVGRAIKSTLDGAGRPGTILASLSEHRDDRHAILETRGALFVRGYGSNVDPSSPLPAALPVLLSGRTQKALRSQAERLRDHLAARPDLELIDIGHSLATTRPHFEHGAALVVHDRVDLMETLEAVVQGRPTPSAVLGRSTGDGKLVFVFPGQGPHWVGMALPLIETSRVFREQMEACERALAPHVDWSLLGVLRGEGDEPALARVDVVQPALFSVMVSLAALWRSMGVEPDAVVGHSQGEIAAAFVAGALSLDDAAKVVALRSRALTRLAGKGAMAAVGLGVDQLAKHLDRFGERLSVGAVNSPRVTLVSGEPAALDALLGELAATHVFTRKVRVDYASHCNQIEAVEDELLEQLAGIAPRAPTLPLYSTVTGTKLEGTPLDAAYWYRNLREAVRFKDATQSLLSDGHRFFVEISPHPVLAVSLNETFEYSQAEPVVVGSLRRSEGGFERFLRSVAELHVRGYHPDWSAFFRPFRPRRVDLPTYAFQRERFWLDEPKGISADATRPASLAQLRSGVVHPVSLLRVDWTELPTASPSEPRLDHWALVAPDGSTPPLLASADQLDRYADLATFTQALDRGSSLPDGVILRFGTRSASAKASDVIDAAHRATGHALSVLQAWLADERLASVRLVVLTRHAVATHADEDITDLVHAPLWGLVRSAQAENPNHRILLVDSDDSDDSRSALPFAVRLALDSTEPQLALRDGRRLVPRLAQPRAEDALLAPLAPWRLDIPTKGTLESLALVPYPTAAAPLADGQVRVAVHAAGLNFRDVIDAPGVTSGDLGLLGGEGAGVITALGPGVSHFAVGDRVMGLFSAAFGPVAVTDARLIARMPAGYSFIEAASIPVVFLTAYYGLVDLARLQRGERVLVHAAAGGVGMAAVQLARHMGAEIFATASPDKWDTLRAHGFDPAHMASSRTLDFEQHFLASTGGHGVDVVLDCLAREFVDASLRLLPRGGRFLEMGKTDIRDASAVADTYPGVAYQAYDMIDAGPDRIQQMLIELLALFERGVLRLLPITARDVRHAPRAFRALARARHVEKLVLTIPRPLAPEGTTLITGGTGTLGALLAHHLVGTRGVKHLLLTSRKGAGAPGALSLKRDLEAAGACVTLAACDASDRHALEALLTTVPPEHPLTAVVHAAGVLDDGVLASLTPERLHPVLRAKVDAALHLHELTQNLDLSAFVLFSSISGVFGTPGQANYAAANAFLDALARHRRVRGLPAVALDWGYWAEKSGMTAHLGDADLERVARAGILPLSSVEGLALFDDALARPDSAFVAAHFDTAALRARADALPALLRGIVRAKPARPVAANTATASSLERRLVSLSHAERQRALLDLVRAEIATVLGSASPSALEPDRPLHELGLGSLMAVELRNRLAATTDLRLHATLLFDYPTANELTTFLLDRLFQDGTTSAVLIDEELDRLETGISALYANETMRKGLTTRLQALLSKWAAVQGPSDLASKLDSASDDELFRLIDDVRAETAL